MRQSRSSETDDLMTRPGGEERIPKLTPLFVEALESVEAAEALRQTPLANQVLFEQNHPDVREVAERLFQAVKEGRIEEYRDLLKFILAKKTPLQVLVIFHVIRDGEGNGLLHWMAQAHTPDFVRELKYMMEAFNVKIPAEEAADPGDFLRQTQRKSLSEFWPGTTSGDRSLYRIRKKLPLMALLEEQARESRLFVETSQWKQDRWIQQGQRILLEELKAAVLKEGEAPALLAALRGDAFAYKAPLFDSLINGNQSGSPARRALLEEMNTLALLLTPPLYTGNKKGQSPLQLAEKTAPKEQKDMKTLLQAAEKHFDIDTLTDPPSPSFSLKKGIGSVGLLAVGMGCPAVFE